MSIADQFLNWLPSTIGLVVMLLAANSHFHHIWPFQAWNYLFKDVMCWIQITSEFCGCLQHACWEMSQLNLHNFAYGGSSKYFSTNSMITSLSQPTKAIMHGIIITTIIKPVKCISLTDLVKVLGGLWKWFLETPQPRNIVTCANF